MCVTVRLCHTEVALYYAEQYIHWSQSDMKHKWWPCLAIPMRKELNFV
jgi:hypothetical protein